MDEMVDTRWRRLAVRQWGSPDGYPVFLLHGTPGSRLSARPAEADLLRAGIRLITYDRPGYGRSDPRPGRSVADAADDVRVIADSLGVGEFAVVGRSGGGPHALACAALLPDRVTRVASLVGLAPFGAEGLDWLQGMGETNRLQYGAAALGPAVLAKLLYPQVVAMRSDPEHFVRRLEADAAPEDRALLSDGAYRGSLIAAMTEALHQSLDGWISDNLAFTRPWGFDPAAISIPTLLWHGVRDAFAPVGHARWLARQIGHAVLHLSEYAHLSAVAAQQDVIRWLTEGRLPPADPS